ncbi:unnamed protein product [Musa banksii]
MHLANVALSVSLASARSTSTMMTRMSAISSTAPRHGDARRLGERAPRVAHDDGALGGQEPEVSDQQHTNLGQSGAHG